VSVNSFTATLIDDRRVSGNTIPSHCTVIDIEPELIGTLVATQVAVSDAPAGLGDLVPLARTLAGRIIDDAINHACDSGENVPCGKGCAACCSYLVPLSAPEALCMGRELGPLSETADRTTARALTDAAGKIIAGWPESPFAQSDSDDSTETGDIEAVGRWYASLELPCAFLSEGACTIYDKRPLACREHAVLGTSADCQGFSPDTGTRLELPVKILDALGQVAADLEQTEVQAVMMPLVPFWYEENARRTLQTWPGPELVSKFLNCLSDTASQPANISEAA
jgi:Fe-S-cluster containining protein